MLFAAAFQKIRRGDVELAGLLPVEEIEVACAQEAYQYRAQLYTPARIVLTFLGQLMRADRSCQQAVCGLRAQRQAHGQTACSTNTGGYCKARQRLPEGVVRRLAQQAGQDLESQAKSPWLWQGRRVRIVDGSTLQIADTEANRSAYPLQRNLKPGCHYPVVRILVVFSLAVGAVLRGVLGPYRGKGTGETAMLREVADCFQEGDVLLGDRYFAGYWDIAWWLQRGMEIVTRLPASRRGDFRRGLRLGPNDHLVSWKKTPRPDWLTCDEAAALPQLLTLREVRVGMLIKGFRPREIIVVTTLLDPQAYPPETLTDLYRRRWSAELNLRSLKTHLGMEHLVTKHPETLRKEFFTYLLAYNCVRKVMLEAAARSDQLPWQISFKGTKQALSEFLPRLHQSPSLEGWLEHWLETAAQLTVGRRPNRIEPYRLKRRPKDYPPLKQPRHTYKKRNL